MIDDNYEKTFVVKMAISSRNEAQLLRFLSIIIDDENLSLSFDNLMTIKPELMMIAHNPILYLLNWRLEHWGVIQDCDGVVKSVQNVEHLFDSSNGKYVEYLQYTTLFNVPVKLFMEISNYFNNLKFEIIFIKNDLNVGGKITIKNGEIKQKFIINCVDRNYIDLIKIGDYMYDDNYNNFHFDVILQNIRSELN